MSLQKKDSLTIRLSADAREKLIEAQNIGLYQLTATQVVERGIELALEELRMNDEKRKGLGDGR